MALGIVAAVMVWSVLVGSLRPVSPAVPVPVTPGAVPSDAIGIAAFPSSSAPVPTVTPSPRPKRSPSSAGAVHLSFTGRVSGTATSLSLIACNVRSAPFDVGVVVRVGHTYVATDFQDSLATGVLDYGTLGRFSSIDDAGTDPTWWEGDAMWVGLVEPGSITVLGHVVHLRNVALVDDIYTRPFATVSGTITCR
jgi:hypothetical protein